MNLLFCIFNCLFFEDDMNHLKQYAGHSNIHSWKTEFYRIRSMSIKEICIIYNGL